MAPNFWVQPPSPALNISPNSASAYPYIPPSPQFHHPTPQLPRDTRSSRKMPLSCCPSDSPQAGTAAWNAGPSHCWHLHVLQPPDQMPSPLQISVSLLRPNCSSKLELSGISRQGIREILLAVSPMSVQPAQLLPKGICFCSAIHMYLFLGNVAYVPSPGVNLDHSTRSTSTRLSCPLDSDRLRSRCVTQFCWETVENFSHS